MTSRRRQLGLVLSLPALVAPAVVLPAAPAGAAVKAPPSKSLPAALDVYVPYQGQTICDPRPRPGVVAFARLMTTHYAMGSVCAHRPHLRQRPVRALRRPGLGLDAQRHQPLAEGRRPVGARLADGSRQERRARAPWPAASGSCTSSTTARCGAPTLRSAAGLPTTAPPAHRPRPLQLQLQRRCGSHVVVDRGRPEDRPHHLAAGRHDVALQPDDTADPDALHPRADVLGCPLLRDDERRGEDAADQTRRPAGHRLLRQPHQGEGHRVPEVRRVAPDRRRRPPDAGDPRAARVAHHHRRLSHPEARHDLGRGQDPADQARGCPHDGLLRHVDEGPRHGIPEVRRAAHDRRRRPRHPGPPVGPRLDSARCSGHDAPTRR